MLHFCNSICHVDSRNILIIREIRNKGGGTENLIKMRPTRDFDVKSYEPIVFIRGLLPRDQKNGEDEKNRVSQNFLRKEFFN
jgi:hypothetical protein